MAEHGIGAEIEAGMRMRMEVRAYIFQGFIRVCEQITMQGEKEWK
jgi:hypothetical protein